MGIFEEIIEPVLIWEGRKNGLAGYVNRSDDPGGETVSGISRVHNPEFPGWEIVDSYKNSHPGPYIPGSDLDRMLGSDTILARMVFETYRAKYWKTIKGDQLKSPGIAYAMLDSAILGGPGAAAIWAQMASNRTRDSYILASGDGMFEKLDEDGGIGPKTISSLNFIAGAKMPENGIPMASIFIDEFFDARREFHKARASRYPEVAGNLTGWLNRCDDVEKRCHDAENRLSKK